MDTIILEEKKPRNQDVITGLVVVFLLGMLAQWMINDMFFKFELPEAITIENKDHEEIGYAQIDGALSEFVMIHNARVPGLFMAFPVYGDTEEFKKSIHIIGEEDGRRF